MSRTPESAAARRSPARRAVSLLADMLVPTENPSGAVLGLIVIGALLAAESGRHESYLDTLVSAALAALLYGAAHAYAEVLEIRLTQHRRLTVGVVVKTLVRDATLIRGAAVPLVALAVAALAGATEETAVTIAVWSVVASLAALELLAGVRAKATASELVLETAAGVAMGLAVLALKIILH